MGKFITNVTKILLSLMVAGMISPSKISVAQATTITHGSSEFESLDSVPSGTGLENYQVKINGLDNGRESLSINELPIHCDLDPKSCGATKATNRGNTADTTRAGNARISTGSTAGDATENSEPTALLLVILGLIGLSRLRGRPID